MALTHNFSIFSKRKLAICMCTASKMYICRHLSVKITNDGALHMKGLFNSSVLTVCKRKASMASCPSIASYSSSWCADLSTYKAGRLHNNTCNVGFCSSTYTGFYSPCVHQPHSRCYIDSRHTPQSFSPATHLARTLNVPSYLHSTSYTKLFSYNCGPKLSAGKLVNSASFLSYLHTGSSLQQQRLSTTDSTKTPIKEAADKKSQATAAKLRAKKKVSGTASVATGQGLGLLGKRPVKKKAVTAAAVKADVFLVFAMATAEEYDLESLGAAIENHALYTREPLPKDATDALHLRAKYTLDDQEEPREIFLFRQGCVVFWNVPEVEKNEMLLFLNKHTDDNYDASVILHETEEMNYAYTETTIDLLGDTFQLNQEDIVLSKYTFSNALSSSVKLAIWEASLEIFVESIEPVLEDLKFGRKIRMSRQHALQKTGELFTLRHQINLSSDLLDLPDFYWDRESLETLYKKTCTYLNVYRRTTVINEKLSHCCDLTELLTDNLNDAHHIRLEWMIIALIFIEVLFELVHYYETYFIEVDQKTDKSKSA